MNKKALTPTLSNGEGVRKYLSAGEVVRSAGEGKLNSNA
jgi:hypothetical protein